MQKTDLGFYLITDEEYYSLSQPEKDTVYVLVNETDEQFLVLKNGQFMGKIDKGLKEMKMTANAVAPKAPEKKSAAPGLKNLTSSLSVVAGAQRAPKAKVDRAAMKLEQVAGKLENRASIVLGPNGKGVLVDPMK